MIQLKNLHEKGFRQRDIVKILNSKRSTISEAIKRLSTQTEI